ncbi:MAG: CRISPR-associated endonuclease Cas1 [Thermoplasmatota archaeon]
MKSLLLSGYNIHLNVNNDKLIVMDGTGWNKEPTEMIFELNFINYDNIIIHGQSGNITLSAIEWLMKHKVSINFIDKDGSFLTSMNPPQLKFGHVKMAQYKAYQNNRIEIGKKFIEAKVQGIEIIMKWLEGRYPKIRPHLKKMDFDRILEELKRTKTDRDLLRIEEDLSKKYWAALTEIFSDNFDLDGKGFGSTNASKDPVNPIKSLFKYGYAILESICSGAINGANLDPYIGFIHRMEITRLPLVEDLKEPYQWLVDMTIIQALEDRTFRQFDFILNDDLTLQLKPEALKRLIMELNKTFSQPFKYKGRKHQGYVLIQIKVQEFSHYIMNNRKSLDFSIPAPFMEAVDNKELRDKILNITYADWKKKGYSPGSLHYLKKIAESNMPLKLNQITIEKLDSIDT